MVIRIGCPAIKV